MSKYKKKGGNGGKRAGAGPKRKRDPIVTYSVRMSHAHAEMLRLWGGGDISAGLRWVMDNATMLVRLTPPEHVTTAM
jgi:hypothetical protein